MFRLVGSERNGLEPHHPPEIASEQFAASIVTTRTEQVVSKRDIGVIEKFRIIEFRIIHLLHFFFSHLEHIALHTVDRFVGQQRHRHSEISSIPFCQLPNLRVRIVCADLEHGLLHSLREVEHPFTELVLLRQSQQCVEIDVKRLKVQVGGDKTREVAIVIVLIHLEKLVVGVLHNRKPVFCEHRFQFARKVLKLVRVDHIFHIHFLSGSSLEILLLELIFTSFEFRDESRLCSRILDWRHLFTTIKIRRPTVVHFLVIPACAAEKTAQLTTVEDISLPCSKGVPQHTELTERELRNIHFHVDVSIEFLHINLSFTRNHDGSLLCRHCDRQHRQQN